MSSVAASLLRAYDIRGIYNKDLTEQAATELGKRFGSCVNQRCHTHASRIVMARDGRVHSPQLAQAFAEGLRFVGCHVIDAGLAPTPIVSFALREKDAGFHAGVMITGSHNPPEHNGFKLALGDHPFFGDDIQRLGMEENPTAAINTGSYTADSTIVHRYTQHLLSRCPQLPKGLSLTWDCGHGVTGPIVRTISDTWISQGASVRILYEEVDGTFPAHPADPSHAANMVDLVNAVNNPLSIGLAFDGDGDRLGVVLPGYGLLSAEQVLWHMMRKRLVHKPGGVVLMDVKMSAQLPPLIRKHGGSAFVWKTGHAHIKNKMFELPDIAIAGEASGHFFFPELGYDDGLYAAMEVLAQYNELEGNLKLYPPSCITPELRLHCDDPHQAMRELKAKLDQQKISYNDLDGVRIESDQGWWLARASHTEAVITVRVESFKNDLSPLVQEVHELLTHILIDENLNPLLNAKKNKLKCETINN